MKQYRLSYRQLQNNSAIAVQQNVQVILEHYEVEKESLVLPLDFHCLSTFPIAKCVVIELAVLCLASQCDVTRLFSLIPWYNNIIELLKMCFCALHDTNNLFIQ